LYKQKRELKNEFEVQQSHRKEKYIQHPADFNKISCIVCIQPAFKRFKVQQSHPKYLINSNILDVRCSKATGTQYDRKIEESTKTAVQQTPTTGAIEPLTSATKPPRGAATPPRGATKPPRGAATPPKYYNCSQRCNRATF